MPVIRRVSVKANSGWARTVSAAWVGEAKEGAGEDARSESLWCEEVGREVLIETVGGGDIGVVGPALLDLRLQDGVDPGGVEVLLPAGLE